MNKQLWIITGGITTLSLIGTWYALMPATVPESLPTAAPSQHAFIPYQQQPAAISSGLTAALPTPHSKSFSTPPPDANRYILRGTIVNGEQSLAFIEVDGTQSIFKPGGRLNDDWSIASIGTDHVMLASQDGDTAELHMTASFATGNVAPQSTVNGDVAHQTEQQAIPEYEFQQYVASATAGSAPQIMNPVEHRDAAGNPVGFDAASVIPEPLFTSLGLLRGDILLSINGRTITYAKQAMELIRQIPSPLLKVRRAGEEKRLRVHINKPQKPAMADGY